MPLPFAIAERVETFTRNLESYLSPEYKEAQLRREFLDPMFEALGWDVSNRAGHAEAYKEVVHEDTLRISGVGTTAPDYSFRIGGTRKFFVEAKKPSVHLKDDPEPAAQLRRYSWSAKLPLGIVTDFQEFAVYDTRVRPKEGDKASVARIFYCTYEQFAEKWDEIAGIFSREAIWRGSFDKYAATAKGKRGTAEFDDSFLEDMEGWRKRLAENLALRNRELTQRELNFAVQRTLDRIIFLRIAEDRGIESYGQLQALLAGPRIYPRLCELFERADFRYNSGLFHFAPEKGREESPDRLTLGLTIDDAALKEIIGALYYPKSPYAFAVIPADILGHVYEQFLGNVIYLTEGHRAHVDQKPEVRKAGGVYYTPTYIVEYIVQQTLGPLVEGKTPKQVEKLRVLDPACGSGSFLLGAYQFLLDWHLKYYLAHEPAAWAQKKNAPIYQTNPNAGRDAFGVRKEDVAPNWQLTTAERKRILTANLYGVDIDAQAVEVTKLSLLLKVLEGEARELRGRQMDFHRVLPDLGSNIKCGNSLIGSDFYQQPSLPEFDEEAKYKINVFDWDVEFSGIMKAGGFDAVIGNPPYIPLELWSEPERNYVRDRYRELQRKFDSSAAFVLAFLPRLKGDGCLGYIAPQTWETGENYGDFRRAIVTRFGIATIVNLPFDVFKDAFVDTGIFIFTKKRGAGYRLRVFPKKLETVRFDSAAFTFVPTSDLAAPDYRIILNPLARKLLERTNNGARFVALGQFTISTQGLAGNRFSLWGAKRSEFDFPMLVRGQARRYFLEIGETGFTSLEDKPSLSPYYKEGKKLLIRRVISRQDRLLVAMADQRMVFKKDINPFIITDPAWVPEYLLGILNSKLLSWFYMSTSAIAAKDDFRQTTLAELRRLPIPIAPKSGPANHDKVVSLVERMMKLHEDLSGAKSPDAQMRLQREIASTDRQIDQLVYQLYELTPEEIALVEQATAPAEKGDGDDQEEAQPAAEAKPANEPGRLSGTTPSYAQAEADAAHHYFAKEDGPEPGASTP